MISIVKNFFLLVSLFINVVILIFKLYQVTLFLKKKVLSPPLEFEL